MADNHCKSDNEYPDTTTKLITLQETQKICGGESLSGIYRAIRRGELTAVKRGNRTLIELDSVHRRARSFPKAKLKQVEG